MGILRFRGLSQRIDMPHLIQSHAQFRHLRDQLMGKGKMSERHANQIVERMFSQAIRQVGDGYIHWKSGIMDRLVETRSRLDANYQDLLNFDGRTGAVAQSARQKLAQLQALYGELDKLMVDLRRPPSRGLPKGVEVDPVLAHIESVVDGAGLDKNKRRPTADRTIELDVTEGRLKGKNFTEIRPGVWSGSGAKGFIVELSVVDGKYVGVRKDLNGKTINTVTEHQILPSHNLVATRLRGVGTFLQSHHGFQNHAMSKRFKAYGYNPNHAPTIILRNRRTGSPHQHITSVQNANKNTRVSKDITYSEIRDICISDLKMINVDPMQIREFLRAHDEYFMRDVFPNFDPNLSKEGLEALLGTWTPPGGGLP